MSTISITLSEDQLLKVIEAYKTIQEFLATALSPNELYHADFIKGLHESDEDIQNHRLKEVKSLNDFIS